MKFTKKQQAAFDVAKDLISVETVDEICAMKIRGEIETFTEALDQNQKAAVFQLAHMLRKSPLRAFALLA